MTRVPYQAQVDGRGVIERAVAMRQYLRTRDWRVLTASLHLVTLQSLSANETTVGQVAKVADLSVRMTNDSLGMLTDAGVLIWVPSTNRGKTPSRLVMTHGVLSLGRLMKRVESRRNVVEDIDVDPSEVF